MERDQNPGASPARSPWAYLRRYRVRIAVGVVALLATNILALTVPYLLGRTVDALRKPDPAHEVARMALLMVGFAVGQAVTRVLSRTQLFNAARMAEADLRSELFDHLLTLEPAYYRDHPTGDVMSRLTSDVQTVRALWGPAVLNVVNTTFMFTMALGLMIHIDPVLTLWALLPYPTIFFMGRLAGRHIHRASRAVQEQLGKLSNSVQEDLTGIGVIKSYTLEERRRGHFGGLSETLLTRNMSLTLVRGLLMPLMTGLASLGVVMVIYVGGRAVVTGRIGLGQLVQFNAYLALLLWPTMALGWMIALFQRGLASWKRLRELLDHQPIIVSGSEELPEQAGGGLEIKGLSLAFDGNPVLEGVDLHVAPGTITAIVGRTGAGKSVLVETLPRLIDTPANTVFLDGVNITRLKLSELRKAIGYAPQEAFLFSTTIARNIAFGYESSDGLLGDGATEPPIDHDKVLAAATAAGLTRDLAALPDGLDTVVGERGITLSGGQRQRVALARALATTPRVLVLDDSLSAVDAETEAEILGHLGEVLGNRTAIIISHRVAAVRRADQIVVLDAGKVVEVGSHEQLLASGGPYAELYRNQLEESGEQVPATAEAT